MKNVFAFALLISVILSVASGFATPGQSAFGVKSASRTTATRIFSDKSDTPSPLPLATDPEEDADPEVQRMVAINLAKGEEFEIPDFVDPAMIQASSNPFQMSWWAWIICGYPFIMLADDAFHFLPKGGIPALLNFN
mmetsp:Transcript_21409/g.25836  ORF Transcript_21409/g.25836 Transcript_21409/m.25836 type:complete len:137 (-) Transcript_21409:204-614(-)